MDYVNFIHFNYGDPVSPFEKKDTLESLIHCNAYLQGCLAYHKSLLIQQQY